MNKNNHIAVLRSSAMGDVAMTVPVILALVEQNDVRVTMVAPSFFEPIFQNIPNVSFYATDYKGKHKGVLGLRKLAKELATLDITAVADLHDVLRSNIVLLFLQLRGFSSAQIDKGRKGRKALIRKKNRVFKRLQSGHERYADVFRKMGYDIVLNKKHILPKAAKQPLHIVPNKKNIGIAPFAAHVGKRYPLDLMEKVIASLSQNHQVLLFGGPAEKEVLQAIAEKYEDCISLAGELSFAEDLEHISHLDTMLAMDSGNGHLAANYGIPVVTIWGVTHPYAGFQVYEQPDEYQVLPDLNKYPLIPTSIFGEKYPDGYLSCFETISPEKIINTINQAIRWDKK